MARNPGDPLIFQPRLRLGVAFAGLGLIVIAMPWLVLALAPLRDGEGTLSEYGALVLPGLAVCLGLLPFVARLLRLPRLELTPGMLCHVTLRGVRHVPLDAYFTPRLRVYHARGMPLYYLRFYARTAEGKDQEFPIAVSDRAEAERIVEAIRARMRDPKDLDAAAWARWHAQDRSILVALVVLMLAAPVMLLVVLLWQRG